jgi:hypothetical protein
VWVPTTSLIPTPFLSDEIVTYETILSQAVLTKSSELSSLLW